MAFPTTGILTTFTGPDEEPLSEGGLWTGGTIRTSSATIKPCRRVDNMCGPSTLTGNTAESAWATSYGADQECYITLVTLALSFQDVYVRLTGAGNTATAQAYFCGWDGTLNGGSGAMYIYKLIGGVYTQLGSNFNITLGSGDKIGISAIGTSITGYYYQSGSWQTNANIQATDSAISGSGALGIDLSSAGAYRMDDFGGGDVVVGGNTVAWLTA